MSADRRPNATVLVVGCAETGGNGELSPKGMGLIGAKLGFFQANSPARQLTLALNEAIALKTLSYGPVPTLISGQSLAFF